MSTPTPSTDTEITFTEAYTCTHHNDAERTACPVCLVTALTAEREQLRAENATLRAAQKACEACDEPTAFEVGQLRARAERAEADLYQVASERTDGILRESDLQCRLNMERARLKKIETALKDAISTYFGDDKLVTAERIEAWQAALKEDAK